MIARTRPPLIVTGVIVLGFGCAGSTPRRMETSPGLSWPASPYCTSAGEQWVDPPATRPAASTDQLRPTSLRESAPRYPSELRAQGMQGRVVASFLIDTTGAVDVRSIRIMEANHPAFAAAVCTALPRSRFRDAIGAPPASPVRMTAPFQFELASTR